MTNEEIRKVLEDSFLDYNEEADKWVWVYKNGDERIEVPVGDMNEDEPMEKWPHHIMSPEEIRASNVYEATPPRNGIMLSEEERKELEERLDTIFNLAMMNGKYGGDDEKAISNLIKSQIMMIKITLHKKDG